MLITCSSCTCLIYGDPPCHTGKLVAPGVIGIIDNNRSLVESLSDIVEHNFEINNEAEEEISDEEQVWI